MATLKDIAKIANVSTCTVSRYLSSDIVIKKETQEKIQRAIEELGYVPNVVAKSLKLKETSNVAVILPKVNNLYYSEITSGISQTLAEHDYNLFIYEVENLNLKEDEILQLMKKNMAAGIIFIGLFPDTSFSETIHRALEWGIPVVYANRYIPHVGFPLVYPDLVKAGQLGVSHLFLRGRNRIALVHKNLPNHLLGHFVDGFKQASNGEEAPLILGIEDGMDLSKDCIPHFLRRNIDGVFVLNELSAVYLTKALVQSNIRIPEDISVLSLGSSIMSEISTPELSCVDLQNRELGVRSAEVILSQIRKQQYEPITVLEPFIVERRST